MHQGARPLPAAHRQFVMRWTAVFVDAPVMTAMLMLFRMPYDHDLQHAGDRAPWSSAMLARQPEVGQHSPKEKVPKKGVHLRSLWSRLAWLATVLVLAVPVAAAPLHRIVAVGD